MDGIGLHLTSKEEREERIEELMQEISISSIENYAVEGLIRGMKIEMENIDM
jgi:ABC-type multidrug transport system ATPase subunit